MKLRHLSLLLCFPLLALTLRAQSAEPVTLSTQNAHGGLNYIWTPYDSVEIGYLIRFVELFPNPDNPKRLRWRAPQLIGSLPPEQTANSSATEQTLRWLLPERPGYLKLARSGDAQLNRLVARDSWTCEPTEGAFIVREIQIDLSKYPDCSLSLIEPIDPEITVRYPLLAQAMNEKRAMFSSGRKVTGKGFRLDGLGGGSLSLTFSE